MSEQKTTEKAAPRRRESVRVRVEHLRQSRQRSPLGFPELVGLAASALMLLAVIFAYLFFLRPATANLDAAQLKRQENYKRLESTRQNISLNKDKEVTVAEVTQSVQDFEENRLSSRNAGRVTLLDTLNKLVRANGLRNTAVNYTALDPPAVTRTQNTQQRTGSSKWQSLYPGLGINLTVEGSYPNLRRFVREIETSNLFVIINAVELEKATDSSVTTEAPTEEGAQPVARGSLVSLRLDMAAYFRREGASAESEVAPTTVTR